YRKKEDRFSPKKFNFEEKLINFNYTLHKINKYHLNILSNYGTTKNFLLDNAAPQSVFYSTLDFSTYIWPRLNVGLSVNFERTNKNSFDNTLVNSIYYGANLQYQIRNKLNLNLFYRNDYAQDEIETDAQSFLEAQLEVNLHKNHQFTFSASQSSIPSLGNNLDKELFINASYRYILNVPLAKDKTKGILKGKFKAEENLDLEGILISIGNKATVTDKNGEFIIYNIEPNEYNLNIAQSSLPKNKIVIENISQKIDILPNQEKFLNLTLGNTGLVVGEIILNEVNFTKSSKFKVKLPKIVVKISKGNKKYLTQTNKEGKFKFNKLTPGEWTVELMIKNLQQQFNFSNTKQLIIVTPNIATEVKFDVSQKNREIKKIKKTFKL
ncbi:MAG TPA: hypothetical protein VJ970_02320, partial [Flavobacteriaceae bacterium]|nr:hypothetical protein [Flavobacteriaceae bacterium]